MKPRSLSCTPASLTPMFSVLTARPALGQPLPPGPRRADHPLPALLALPPPLHFLSRLEHPRPLHDGHLVLLHQELAPLRILAAHAAGALQGDAVVRLDGPRLDA